MKNEKVMQLFIQGEKFAKSYTNNLRISNGNLWNYRTLLAKFDHDKNVFVVNITKYSPTTSRIQNKLLQLLSGKKFAPIASQKINI
jgi:hypothetical protein